MLGDILARIGEALRNLAGGRKALFAIITLVTLLFMNYFPSADPTRTLEVSKLIGAVVGVVILGITIEDSVKSWTESRATGLEELLKAILDALQGKYDVRSVQGSVYHGTQGETLYKVSPKFPDDDKEKG